MEIHISILQEFSNFDKKANAFFNFTPSFCIKVIFNSQDIFQGKSLDVCSGLFWQNLHLFDLFKDCRSFFAIFKIVLIFTADASFWRGRDPQTKKINKTKLNSFIFWQMEHDWIRGCDYLNDYLGVSIKCYVIHSKRQQNSIHKSKLEHFILWPKFESLNILS